VAQSRASETEATTICLCLLATSQLFSYWTALVLPRAQPKLSAQTELSLPPHTTTLLTTTGSGKYNLMASFHVHHIFYKCFVAMTHFSQFIIYGPTMERAETWPTDWVWPPALHHHLVNINRQRQVYICGALLGLLYFLQMMHSYFAYYFSFRLLQSQQGMAKTQPTDWVWLPALHHCLANINGQRLAYFEG
jgi:hypothetical protein